MAMAMMDSLILTASETAANGRRHCDDDHLHRQNMANNMTMALTTMMSMMILLLMK